MPENEKRTRRALEAALWELLKRKPLDRLRVREVTELCGLRRQSFYYHFKDVYDLFDWSIQRERALLLARQEDCLTWRQALGDLLERIACQRAFYQAVLRERGRPGLRELLPLSGMLEKALAYYRSRCGLSLDAAAEQTQLQSWETVLLSLLESWTGGELELEPGALLDQMERSVEQSAAGAAWQSLRSRNMNA